MAWAVKDRNGRVGVIHDSTDTDSGEHFYIKGLEMKLKERFMGICAFLERELVRA